MKCDGCGKELRPGISDYYELFDHISGDTEYICYDCFYEEPKPFEVSVSSAWDMFESTITISIPVSDGVNYFTIEMRPGMITPEFVQNLQKQIADMLNTFPSINVKGAS
jgi:hypothetical protein